MATIWDADILIWAATQVTEALDRGGVACRLSLPPPHLLKGIRRHTGGDQYRKLLEALGRLQSTVIRTNIRQRGTKGGAFHWIEEYRHRRTNRAGRSACRSRCPAGCTTASSSPAAC